MNITLEKLKELIYYYEISNQFLNDIEQKSTDTATPEDLEKLASTKDLFFNTLVALNQLNSILINTTDTN